MRKSINKCMFMIPLFFLCSNCCFDLITENTFESGKWPRSQKSQKNFMIFGKVNIQTTVVIATNKGKQPEVTQTPPAPSELQIDTSDIPITSSIHDHSATQQPEPQILPGDGFQKSPEDEPKIPLPDGGTRPEEMQIDE